MHSQRWLRPAWREIRGDSDLPDLARFFTDHGLAQLTRERRLKFRHIRYYAVYAVFKRRMRVGYGVCPQVLGPFAAAGPLRHADKESLIGREPVDGLQHFAFVGGFPCYVREERSAQIGNVLA